MRKALIPDGYFPNGKARPCVIATILEENANYYLIALKDGQKIPIPKYTPFKIWEEEKNENV